MKTIFGLMILMSTLVAHAGEKGNGGGVHLCPSTIQMYDLYEAENRQILQLYTNATSVQEFLDRAMAKLHNKSPDLYNKVLDTISYVRSHLVIRAGMKLTPIPDANILMVDEGCEYAQLANWDDRSGNIFVKKEFYDRLNNQNVASLIFHEALYKVYRDDADAENSDEVRFITGDAFSTNLSIKLEDLEYGLPDISALNEVQGFHILKNDDDNMVLDFHLQDAYKDLAKLSFSVTAIYGNYADQTIKFFGDRGYGPDGITTLFKGEGFYFPTKSFPKVYVSVVAFKDGIKIGEYTSIIKIEEMPRIFYIAISEDLLAVKP